jgi:hypothetical protein
LSVSVPSPPFKRPRSVAVYSGQRPTAVAMQIFAVVVREFPASSGPTVQSAIKVQHVSVICVNEIA